MTQRRIACLLADDFQDEEFSVPVAALRERGFVVDIVGVKVGDSLHGKHRRAQAKTDTDIDACSPVHYLGVLIPGGGSPQHLSQDKRFPKFLRDFDSSGKPIAAICHGPQLLMAAGLAKGRTLTGNKSVQSEAKKAGAHVEDRAVVSDKNWITSRTPDDLPKFVEAILLQFESNANQSWMARGDVHPQEPAKP